MLIKKSLKSNFKEKNPFRYKKLSFIIKFKLFLNAFVSSHNKHNEYASIENEIGKGIFASILFMTYV